MGRRVLDFCRANPSTSAGVTTAVKRLQELLVRADELFTRQRDGILQERTATRTKNALRTTITQGHLNHLVRVARAAEVAPELERRFQLTAYSASFAAFRNEARGIAAEAAAQRELLAKYGLDEMVLDDLEHQLDKFDGAFVQGDAGRRLHITATAGLIDVAADVVALVDVLGGINRLRFANDPERLAAWQSASTVFGPETVGRTKHEQPAA